jgi:hypothetical protein
MKRIGVLYTHFIGRFSEYLPGCKASVKFILRLNYQDEGNRRPKWQVGGKFVAGDILFFYEYIL